MSTNEKDPTIVDTTLVRIYGDESDRYNDARFDTIGLIAGLGGGAIAGVGFKATIFGEYSDTLADIRDYRDRIEDIQSSVLTLPKEKIIRAEDVARPAAERIQEYKTEIGKLEKDVPGWYGETLGNGASLLVGIVGFGATMYATEAILRRRVGIARERFNNYYEKLWRNRNSEE